MNAKPMVDKDYQAECDLRALIEAEKIKKELEEAGASVELK